ncbi:olfactory receptor 52P1-like [Ambystoma mexicanum]|uniref:olfactory receptor 52P1-like n=1 Tax=Ambystoma mexicanum TaxID=8296 RepID=UPI0037E8BDE2
MSPDNATEFAPSTLILIGIPGLTDFHIWFAAPVTAMYIFTLLGNCILLLTIITVMTLHKPMYLFISQLALSDLAVSSCIFPKILSIFWFNAGEIIHSACLGQMFFIHYFLVLESSIFSSMAFDRYVAVCNPLRYAAILTNSLIAKLAVACLVRAFVLILPIPLLVLRLPLCARYIAHTFCENMAVAKLSCVDISLNGMYALTIAIVIYTVDIFCIALSYTLILRTILRLQSKDRFKAFSTCGAHICVMTAFYAPILFSLVLHRLQHNIPLYAHVTLSNAYLLFPPFINPLIFGITMKAVQQGALQFLKEQIARIRSCF